MCLDCIALTVNEFIWVWNSDGMILDREKPKYLEKICARILKNSLNRNRDFQGTKTKLLSRRGSWKYMENVHIQGTSTHKLK
jgi:hypothetical protein